MISGLVGFVSILGGAGLVTQLADVAAGHHVGGLYMLPEPGPGVGLPAAGQTLPPPRVLPLGHLSLYVTVELIWNIGVITRRSIGSPPIALCQLISSSDSQLHGHQNYHWCLWKRWL